MSLGVRPFKGKDMGSKTGKTVAQGDRKSCRSIEWIREVEVGLGEVERG